MRTRRTGRQGGRGERGGALVEAAIVLPLLLLIVFGVVDFGALYSNRTATNQGVRDAARQGIVASFGGNTGCSTTGNTATGSARELVCLTKDRIGLGSAKTRVRIVAPATYAVGQQLLICAEYPIEPVTPLTGRFISTDAIRSKAAMRIEAVAASGLTTGGETALTGSWTWCT